MPAEWALCIVVPVFMEKGDVQNSICYRAVKLFEHVMMVVESVLEKRLCRIVTIHEMSLGFMS